MIEMTEDKFLSGYTSRLWQLDPKYGHQFIGLYVGKGKLAIEVIVTQSPGKPSKKSLLDVWKLRRDKRAAPVLLVTSYLDKVALCGASGEEPSVYLDLDAHTVESLCREILEKRDRHVALKFLSQTLRSLETSLPGINNEGLLALHELLSGVPQHSDWVEAKSKSRKVLGKRNNELLAALGFQIRPIDNLTSLLCSGDRHTALAVLLHEEESAEARNDRFNYLSPISYALKTADDKRLPWVIFAQGSRLRLYATAIDAGVGRRGRTETYIECQTSLLPEKQLPYLWLLYSVDALAEGGSLHRILDDSKRFAGDLAERLRERIYVHVVPVLAKGIAIAQGIDRPKASDLQLTYRMALTTLFRLLFIAYAEDRDLLPYRSNGVYRNRSLKQKAQELADHVNEGRPIGGGNTHWKESVSLWEAISEGNQEWGVPAYNGGLFSSDPNVSPAGAALADITLPDSVFEVALRSLLVLETSEGTLGPVDFRSLGVREFGTIYEGLLESELALASTDLTLDERGSYVPVSSPQEQVAEVSEGDVYLHNRSGIRKSSGSYYTKPFAVEHLLSKALEPALDDHFARLDKMDDDEAAEAFFDFRIADIAMGSGHFLIAAIDRIEKRMANWLADRKLPSVSRNLDELRATAGKRIKEGGGGLSRMANYCAG